MLWQRCVDLVTLKHRQHLVTDGKRSFFLLKIPASVAHNVLPSYHNYLMSVPTKPLPVLSHLILMLKHCCRSSHLSNNIPICCLAELHHHLLHLQQMHMLFSRNTNCQHLIHVTGPTWHDTTLLLLNSQRHYRKHSISPCNIRKYWEEM